MTVSSIATALLSRTRFTRKRQVRARRTRIGQLLLQSPGAAAVLALGGLVSELHADG